MLQRKLGRNGPNIPVIGLGAWPIGGGMGGLDERTIEATIRAAIDGGATLIDTAQAYRGSEHSLGKALKDGYRQRCFLATKVSGDYSPEGIRAAMDNSLRQLQVDAVDLYQIHGWDPVYPLDIALETMETLRQAGKTQYIGVSNYNADQLEKASQVTQIQSNQPRYNMFDREIEALDLPFCADRGIGILAHSPLAKGLLTGRYMPGHRFAKDDERSDFPRFQGNLFANYLCVASDLQEVASEKGLTLVQLAIAWLLRNNAITCVLVGAKSPQQVEEHIVAAQIKFRNEELDRINIILANVPRT